MAQNSNSPQGDDAAPKRPRGILKNSNSYQGQPTSPSGPVPTSDPGSNSVEPDTPSPSFANSDLRPQLSREMSDKELTLQNTLANAGPRRNSSNTRSSISRRQSGTGRMDIDEVDEEGAPRLKWDEANLFHNEGERGATMKIDEPKTPYAKQYDPAEDEDEEIETIDTSQVVVDELDKVKSRQNGEESSSRGRRKESIPDLDLGEPEEPVEASASENSEKRVIVDDSGPSPGAHGEQEESMSTEARRKHQAFEEKRKRHYEMPDVKGMLGHPEELMKDDGEN